MSVMIIFRILCFNLVGPRPQLNGCCHQAEGQALVFQSKKHFDQHDEDGGSDSCDKCDKVYTFRAALRSHKRIVHEGKRLECQLCDKSYTDYTMLKKHMRKFHPIEFSQLKHRKKGKKRCFPDPEFDGPPSRMESEPTTMIGEKNESDQKYYNMNFIIILCVGLGAVFLYMKKNME